MAGKESRMEGYITVQGTACATLVEKKSEFIANLSFADTEEKALEFLDKVRSQHRTARHNVYAYCLQGQNRVRYSDDGEPAKTAGLPVLEVIQHANLTDVVVVVTRYFGGILLGTGGLVRAYTQAAQLAVQQAKLVCVRPVVNVQAAVEYPLYQRAARLFEEAGARVTDTVFGADVTICATLPFGAEQGLLLALSELCRGQEKVQVSPVYHAPF